MAATRPRAPGTTTSGTAAGAAAGAAVEASSIGARPAVGTRPGPTVETRSRSAVKTRPRPAVETSESLHLDGLDDLAVASQLGRAISRLMRVVGRARAGAIAGGGTDFGALPLLTILAESGPMRSNALADAVFSDRSTVSRRVATLVKAGCVDRAPDVGDARASLLTLTERGREALAAHRRSRDEHLTRVLADWPERDRRRVAVLLDRLATDLAACRDHRAEPADLRSDRQLGGSA